jgi:intracellular sulfur oxidation DsrE/DsrF family protein
MKGVSSILRALAAALLIATSATLARAQQAPLQDKPFAEHKVVLQLSDNDPKKQGLVISVANNLMKFYDPDKVAVEIVAFSPGIELLRPENPNRKLVESLVAQGARVDVCLNTVDTSGLQRRRHTGAGRRRPDSVPDRKRLYTGPALTVIASEAKQSISPHKERMDCFVALLLAMTRRDIRSTSESPSCFAT